MEHPSSLGESAAFDLVTQSALSIGRRMPEKITSETTFEELGITRDKLYRVAEQVLDRSEIMVFQGIGLITKDVRKVGDMVPKLVALSRPYEETKIEAQPVDQGTDLHDDARV